MAMLSDNNIESELSYAYLHSVAAKAGMSCEALPRHQDNIGKDARITYVGDTEHSYIREVEIDVQLKATTLPPREIGEFFTYDFKGISQYNNLTINNADRLKILVVLFLPNKIEADEWLKIDSNQLILKKAAYWVCLLAASQSDNSTGQVVYIPKENLLTPESLLTLAQGPAATKKWPKYQIPS